MLTWTGIYSSTARSSVGGFSCPSGEPLRLVLKPPGEQSGSANDLVKPPGVTVPRCPSLLTLLEPQRPRVLLVKIIEEVGFARSFGGFRTAAKPGNRAKLSKRNTAPCLRITPAREVCRHASALWIQPLRAAGENGLLRERPALQFCRRCGKDLRMTWQTAMLGFLALLSRLDTHTV